MNIGDYVIVKLSPDEEDLPVKNIDGKPGIVVGRDDQFGEEMFQVEMDHLDDNDDPILVWLFAEELEAL